MWNRLTSAMSRAVKAFPGSTLALMLVGFAGWAWHVEPAPVPEDRPSLLGQEVTAFGMVTDGLGLMRTSFRAKLSTRYDGERWVVTEEITLPDGRAERNEWRVHDIETPRRDTLYVQAGATLDRANVRGVWTLLTRAKVDDVTGRGRRFAAAAPVFETPYGDGKIEVVFKTTA